MLEEMGVLLSGSALSKSFGARPLFEDLSVSISDGDCVGLIGPNGSGKTTLLEILAGREAPDSGTRALRKQTRLSYVPQDSVFAPEDTVISVLTAGLDGLPLDDEEKSGRIELMLGRADFADRNALAASLSGGWKKRLSIAAALISSPIFCCSTSPLITWIWKAFFGSKMPSNPQAPAWLSRTTGTFSSASPPTCWK